MVATGKKFTFQDEQTKDTGVLEMRVVLDGVMDQYLSNPNIG